MKIFNNYKLLGKIDNKRVNSFKSSKFFDNKFVKINKNFVLEEPILLPEKNKASLNLNDLNENKNGYNN